jgi:hypothetical protein
MVKQRFLKYFDFKAAILFIAAHFLSVLIYKSLVVDDQFIIWQGGFVINMSQAFIYLIIVFINIDIKLRITSFVTFIVFGLFAINWFLIQRGIEGQLQIYFYEYFQSIIITLNLIVIFLLGKDGAIHLFNLFFSCNTFLNKSRLFLRNTYNNCLCHIYLSFSYKNIKSKENGK